MIYYTQKDNIIEKYIVKYKKENIENLKNEIIDNCSDIEHCYSEIDGYFSLKNNTSYEIRNLVIKETNENDSSIKFKKCSYDKYHYPKLVILINRFLKGNVNSLDEIYNLEFDEYIKKDYSIQIRKINEELLEINDLRVKKKKLKELENIITYAIKQDEAYDKYNKDQQILKEYHIELLELINLKLVDTIDISEIDKVENFFDEKIKIFTKKKNV